MGSGESRNIDEWREEEELLEFSERARRVEERVKAIEQRVAAAAAAVQELTRPSSVPAPRIREPEAREEPDAPKAPERRLDINRVSFEQLREIGLSVTEAARLLASRDARGAFRSLDELDDLWGFPKELVERLRRRLTLS